MSHINTHSNNKASLKIGINGNYYVISKSKEAVEEIAKQIGRSSNGVYFRDEYKVWAIRVKLKSHQEKLKQIFRRIKQ